MQMYKLFFCRTKKQKKTIPNHHLSSSYTTSSPIDHDNHDDHDHDGWVVDLKVKRKKKKRKENSKV